MFNSREDNGDASVYEMMCTAGKWGTDEKWKEDKGKPVMKKFFFQHIIMPGCCSFPTPEYFPRTDGHTM